MALQSFKDLVVWQKAKVLTLDIYKELNGCRDYGFKDQIQRASVSIMNNIAEGYAKQSDKALSNFLFIARGSTAEVESMLLIAPELGFLKADTQQKLVAQTEEVGKLLTSFIKRINNS